tara:strand:+ start:187 stop:1341 length:1155 start_codon:yes stop_codon:yes gene_type:complete
MTIISRILISTLLIIFTATGQANPTNPPAIKQIELSPDGNKMLILRAFTENEGYYAVAIDLKNKQNKPIMSGSADTSLNWCKWANNQKIVCSLSGSMEMRARASRRKGSTDGKINIPRRNMYVVDYKTGKSKKLIKTDTKYKASAKEVKVWGPIQDGVISWLPESPNEILIQFNHENLQWPSVYRLNIKDNKLKRVRKYKSLVSQWLADDQGNVRMGIGFKDQQMRLFLVEDNSTRELKSDEIDGLLPSYPLGFSKDGQSVYLEQKNETGGKRVIAVSLKDFQKRETLFSSEFASTPEDLYSPAALRGPGIRQYVPETPLKHLIDASIKQKYQAVAEAIPGPKETVVSTNQDWSKFIVYGWDKTSYSYYLFDVPRNQLMKLGGS